MMDVENRTVSEERVNDSKLESDDDDDEVLEIVPPVTPNNNNSKSPCTPLNGPTVSPATPSTGSKKRKRLSLQEREEREKVKEQM